MSTEVCATTGRDLSGSDAIVEPMVEPHSLNASWCAKFRSGSKLVAAMRPILARAGPAAVASGFFRCASGLGGVDVDVYLAVTLVVIVSYQVSLFAKIL